MERGGSFLGHPPQKLTWSQFAEEQCHYYIVMGVSADEYWNGDYTLLRYYRQAFCEKRELDYYDAWLHGFYVYEAIVDCVPVLRTFSKAKKPLPYPLKPYEMQKEIGELEKKEKDKSQMDKIKTKMESFAASWNKKFNAQKTTDGKG